MYLEKDFGMKMTGFVSADWEGQEAALYYFDGDRHMEIANREFSRGKVLREQAASLAAEMVTSQKSGNALLSAALGAALKAAVVGAARAEVAFESHRQWATNNYNCGDEAASYEW